MVVLTQNKAFQYSLDLAKKYTSELIDEKGKNYLQYFNCVCG